MRIGTSTSTSGNLYIRRWLSRLALRHEFHHLGFHRGHVGGGLGGLGLDG